MADAIPLDELLDQQDKPGRLLATVERIADDDTRVKVTPYVAGAGCLCPWALNVVKEAIESVTRTDDVHVCCGKTLTIVTVNFTDTTLADVFQQITASVASRRGSDGDDHGGFGARHARSGSPSPPYGSPGVAGYSRERGFLDPSWGYSLTRFAQPWTVDYGLASAPQGVSSECLLQCEADLNDCMHNCARMPGWIEYCACECRNMKRYCYRNCGARGGFLEYCPIP